MSDLEACRKAVTDCEKEIQSIKEKIRAVVASGSAGDGSNSLKISAIEVSGLPEKAEPNFKIQVSSPIEELSLSKISDPQSKEEVEVKDVDTSVATLSISAYDADIYLGSSALLDCAPLCEIKTSDSEGSSSSNVTEIDVAIVPDDSNDEAVKKDETPETPATTTEAKETTEVTEEKEADTTESSPGAVKEENPNIVDDSDRVSSVKDKIKALEVKTATETNTEVDAEAKDEDESEESAVVVEKTEGEEAEAETETETPSTTETQPTTETPSESEPVKEKKEEEEESIELVEADETTEEKVAETTTTTTTTDAPDASIVIPICVVKFRMEYTPSIEDKKQALYEKLNEASRRRALAIENLRKAVTLKPSASNAVTTSTGTTTAAASKSKNPKPAVKPGFLNKSSKAKKKVNPIFAFYQKNFGPTSMLRKAIIPIAKNYVIFFGACIFMHFRGQELALPPPQ